MKNDIQRMAAALICFLMASAMPASAQQRLPWDPPPQGAQNGPGNADPYSPRSADRDPAPEPRRYEKPSDDRSY
ncbi:MAG: hypothetical protein AAGC70_20635, partial [Pseudomonadota bacterium]